MPGDRSIATVRYTSICFLAFLLAPFLHAQGQPARGPSAIFENVAHRIDSLTRADTLLSVSVAVVADSGVVWEQGFGRSGRGNILATTSTSVYRLASVAKSITAVATMLLAERGAIDLDEPVSRYLGPDAVLVRSGNPDSLTVKTLLQMTGGIPHVVRFNWADGLPPLGEAEIMKRFAFSAFPPGRDFHYSNMSFGILQAIISRVAKVPFETFVQTEVFGRVGMVHSGLRLDDQDGLEVVGYTQATALPSGGLEPDGGAGFRSSAHDLALLAAALLNLPGQPSLLKSSTVEQMWRFSPLDFYALGWWRDLSRPAEHMVIADGAAAGNSATMMIDPARRIAAVALANRGNGVTSSLTAALLAATVDGFSGLAPIQAPTRPVLPPALGTQPFAVDSRWLGEWCGSVVAGDHSVPAQLQIDSLALLTLRLGSGPGIQGTQPALHGGALRAGFSAQLPGEWTEDVPHRVTLWLRPVGGKLVGYLAAESTLPRPRFVLPFAASLALSANGCDLN